MSTPIRKRTWLESFEALKKYKSIHGDCLVPIHNYHEDLALGGWVNHQRSKKHKLSAEQKQKLDSVGFTWSVRMRNKQWNHMMDKLKAYKEEHDGDCNVPVVYEADTELADFCQEQRKKFARGQLSGARQKQLQDIGLSLVLEEEEEQEEEDTGSGNGSNNAMQQYDDAFDRHYQKLVDFHVTHGHCDIPLESDHELGPWVTALRLKYKEHAESGFSDDCFELLEELGFDWDGPTGASDTEATATETKKEDKKTPAAVAEAVAAVVATAVAAQATTNHNNSSNNNDDDEKKLAAEKEEEEGSDGSESIDEDSGGNLNDNSDSESLSSSSDDNATDSENDDDDDDDNGKPKGFSIMPLKRKSSIITSGMPKKPRRLSSLPINHKKPLLLQVSRKRPALALPTNNHNAKSHPSSNASAASSTTTSSKRVRRSSVNSNSSQQTNSAGSYCPSRDERFMKQYQDLLDFKKQYGHTRVPQSKKWKTLGGWVNNLRVMYKRDPVHGVRKERVKLLNDAGFVWNATADMPSYDVRWEEQYAKLLEFKKEYGHCRVPQTGPHRKLGRWVATQRALYTKDPVNGIRSDRLARLNDAEFTWDAKGFKGKHFYTNTTNPDAPTSGEAAGDNNNNAADATTVTTGGAAGIAATVSNSSATSTEKPSVAITTADSSSTESDDDDDGTSVAAVLAVEGEVPASSIAVAVPVPEGSAAIDPNTVGVEDVVVDTEYDVVWDQNYAKLIEYKKVYNNFKVPAAYDANLSRWVKLQRERKQEKDPRHVKLLDAIGFDWVCQKSNPNKEQPSLNDVRWEQSYHQLVAYKTQHGHCRVPQNGEKKRLGKWVATQRLLHNKGNESGLRPERFKLLDDLGFTWNAKEFRSRKNKTPGLCEEGENKTPGAPQASFSQDKDNDAKSMAVDRSSDLPTTSTGISDASSSLSVSGRIQPLVAKLCELMDHPGSRYSNSSSKLDCIEKYKRSLEGMIDETNGRLESYQQLESAMKEVPPATAIKNET